ncbi:MAG: hypothetical protein BGP05_16815 [Rhizobiales bacterium 62-47]|nr:hypothetical protein [Hyphomicrobiales bacterium]OJY09472.1 MAG: hypothetical protein BGP05_16815 [Rhizobiales bacterium 62-47]
MKSNVNYDIYVAAGLATLVGLLGLFPHIAFINDVGEFRYLHYAYDEDTYTLGWLNGSLRSTRLLSGMALSAVNLIAAGSLNAVMISSDFIFPAMAVLAAYFAASQVAGSKSTRVLIALALVFAGDLFSLGSLAVWNSSALNLFRFSQIIGLIGPNLVPPYETSFLSIYRTPEPQVSMTLMFVLLGLLAKIAKGEHSNGALALLVLTIALLPMGYTFVTFPVALLSGGFFVVLLIFGAKRSAAALAIGFSSAMVVYALASYWEHNGSQSTAVVAAVLSYHTRLPIVTPAVLASGILSVTFAAWLVAEKLWTPTTLLALGALALPLVLSNQQIVTNIMISARDWERNSSYQILLFGSALAASIVGRSNNWRLSSEWPKATVVFAIFILYVAGRGQLLTYRMWLTHNETSIAMVKALGVVDRKELAASKLVLDDVGLAPLLQLRAGMNLNIPLSFYRAGIDLIPNMAAADEIAPPSALEPNVFDHWMRVGIDPAHAEKILRTELRQRAGTYLSFLFSFRDSWYPASDNRAVRSLELERSVSPLIERYRSYLSLYKFRDDPHLRISTKSPSEVSASNSYIGSGKVGGVTSFVYRQDKPSDRVGRVHTRD